MVKQSSCHQIIRISRSRHTSNETRLSKTSQWKSYCKIPRKLFQDFLIWSEPVRIIARSRDQTRPDISQHRPEIRGDPQEVLLWSYHCYYSPHNHQQCMRHCQGEHFTWSQSWGCEQRNWIWNYSPDNHPGVNCHESRLTVYTDGKMKKFTSRCSSAWSRGCINIWVQAKTWLLEKHLNQL